MYLLKKCQSKGILNLPSGYSPSNSQSWGPEGKKIFRFVDSPIFCPAFVVAQLDASAGVIIGDLGQESSCSGEGIWDEGPTGNREGRAGNTAFPTVSSLFFVRWT